jgi:histidine triad (HIT) family protein
MPADPSCIFCRIIAGDIPCLKVYEDDAVLAFLDIGPLVPGHTLVIPKAHCATIMEAPPETLAAIGERLPKISKAVIAAVGASACHLLVNNGSEAMQSVHHLHFHILPRGVGESFQMPWPAGKLDKEAGLQLAKTITQKMLQPSR